MLVRTSRDLIASDASSNGWTILNVAFMIFHLLIKEKNSIMYIFSYKFNTVLCSCVDMCLCSFQLCWPAFEAKVIQVQVLFWLIVMFSHYWLRLSPNKGPYKWLVWVFNMIIVLLFIYFIATGRVVSNFVKNYVSYILLSWLCITLNLEGCTF